MALPAEGFSNLYVPAHGYSDKRQLEAPRVYVPPPELNYQSGKPTFHVKALPFNQTSEQYGNPEFLRALVISHNLKLEHSMLTWNYEMRRNAQSILPFLFLGPSGMARDSAFVRDNGITLLVAARSSKSVQTRPTFLDPARFASSAGIETRTFDFDQPAEFISLVKPTIRAMNKHLEATCTRTPMEDIQDVRGKILIFCESGNDRSALVAAAYLMIVYGVEAVAAIHMVQSQRFCITLSDEMKHVLLDLQAITSAQRQVSDANAAMAPFMSSTVQGASLADEPHRPRKRNINDFYTSDDDMMDDADHMVGIRFREGLAPFADAVD